jgi:hypothetical protein
VWYHWDLYHGHKAAVFRFIESANGSDSRSGEAFGERDIHYYGLVFCSPEDGTVYRLVSTSSYGPKSHNPGSTSTEITKFGPASIDGTEYYFPTEIVGLTHTDKSPFWLRASTVISDYRKFNAKSTIHYPSNN